MAAAGRAARDRPARIRVSVRTTVARIGRVSLGCGSSAAGGEDTPGGSHVARPRRAVLDGCLSNARHAARRNPMGARFWISVGVMCVLALMTGFVVHGILLHSDYAALPNLLRTEADAQGYFGWMILADALIGFGYTWIYLKGRDP